MIEAFGGRIVDVVVVFVTGRGEEEAKLFKGYKRE